MKLASYESVVGDSYGVVTDQGVIDLARRLSGYPTLKSLLAGGALNAAYAVGGEPDYALDEVTFLPVIPDPAKLICVGVNYADHIAEMGRTGGAERPTLFIRYPDSVVGHGRPLIRPKVSTHFDYEGELAVIVGKPARHVPAERALDYVAGYSCFNDGSIRDWQRHTSQFTPGKNFTRSGALGPWMVTADEIADPKALTLTTRLNGQVMQQSTTAHMIFDVPTLIAYITAFTELLPGDVIATGTPSGVGAARQPPVWMQPGDRVEVEISDIGMLANGIEDEA